MYRAFKLSIDEEIIQDDIFHGSIVIGKNLMISEKADIENLLREVFVNGTIDGTALADRYFHTFKQDVFISDSHKDQNLAYMLTGLLSAYFNLTSFVDSFFWGSADKLLKEIDDKYCLNKDGLSYSYEKRNYSTTHVHAMLTSAIMKAMDQAEIVIFLNTPNSAPIHSNAINDQGYDDYTLSPWIYEEVLLTTMLKETPWEIYRSNLRLDESSLFSMS